MATDRDDPSAEPARRSTAPQASGATPAPHGKQPLLRRAAAAPPVVKLLAVVVAGASALALAMTQAAGADLYQRAKSVFGDEPDDPFASRDGLSVAVDTRMEVQSNYSFAFARPLDLELPEDLLDRGYQDFLAVGGVHASPLIVDMVVENHEAASVTLRDLAIERTCSPAPRGTYAELTLGGGDGVEKLYVDLADERPVARAGPPGQEGADTRFFEGRTITLAKGEQVTLVLHAASTDDCTFRLDVQYVRNGTERTHPVPEPRAGEGLPFRVTGILRPNLDDPAASPYSRLYNALEGRGWVDAK